jgi:hypothetical protein
VEAPGTAPGSATLIPSRVYRHSHRSDGIHIGALARDFEGEVRKQGGYPPFSPPLGQPLALPGIGTLKPQDNCLQTIKVSTIPLRWMG